MTIRGLGCEAELDRIFASQAEEIQKVLAAFDCVTDFIIGQTEREIEVARAMHDEPGRVKMQVKMETLKHAQAILQMCHQRLRKEEDRHGAP